MTLLHILKGVQQVDPREFLAWILLTEKPLLCDLNGVQMQRTSFDLEELIECLARHLVV